MRPRESNFLRESFWEVQDRRLKPVRIQRMRARKSNIVLTFSRVLLLTAYPQGLGRREFCLERNIGPTQTWPRI
jgi:hypothetical protein